MEILSKTWPLWITNLGLLATLLGTLITFFILYQTWSLSKHYNKKATNDYLVGTIINLYKAFSTEITKIKPETFNTDNDIKHKLWKLIIECDGCVKVYKKSDKDINIHVDKFKNETESIVNSISDMNSLNYETTWTYYGFLTKFHEVVKNEHDIRTRKV